MVIPFGVCVGDFIAGIRLLNRLPFHLEFINSFEAHFAVFTVRFKDRRDGAMNRIRSQMFDLYEPSKQRRIDLNGRWAKAFLVSSPTTSVDERLLRKPLA